MIRLNAATLRYLANLLDALNHDGDSAEIEALPDDFTVGGSSLIRVTWDDTYQVEIGASGD